MLVTCNLEGHLIIRPDGVEDRAVWVGDDGELMEIYESCGRIHRGIIRRAAQDPAQRAEKARKAQARHTRPKINRMALALDSLYAAIRDTISWKDLAAFNERLRTHATAALARASADTATSGGAGLRVTGPGVTRRR